MPAAQRAVLEGFEVLVEPGWWLRRWTRFPLYFQATQPEFLLVAKKIGEGQLAGNRLRFYIEFADKSRRDFLVDVSGLDAGGIRSYQTPRNPLAPSGDARVCLDRGSGGFDTLYAFVVSSEALLVLSVAYVVLNVILGAVITILIRL